MTEATTIIKSLVTTINGQVRLWAMILTVGPSYWLLTEGEEASDRTFYFVVGLVIVGLVLGAVSIWMAIVASVEQGKAENHRENAELLKSRADKGFDDRTTIRKFIDGD